LRQRWCNSCFNTVGTDRYQFSLQTVRPWLRVLRIMICTIRVQSCFLVNLMFWQEVDTTASDSFLDRMPGYCDIGESAMVWRLSSVSPSFVVLATVKHQRPNADPSGSSTPYSKCHACCVIGEPHRQETVWSHVLQTKRAWSQKSLTTSSCFHISQCFIVIQARLFKAWSGSCFCQRLPPCESLHSCTLGTIWVVSILVVIWGSAWAGTRSHDPLSLSLSLSLSFTEVFKSLLGAF